ncbi:MAG: BtpA/SgcQ family protein [Promethearchaeota archaeon]
MEKQSLIGMIHLPPLLGSPLYDDNQDINDIVQRTTNDLKIYVKHGFSGVIFENYGDYPFYPNKVPPETIASMTAIITRTLENFPQIKNDNDNFEIGINVLRNDAKAALSIAKVTGASFIRINIHAFAFITDQGIIQGKAHETMRYRRQINANNVKIFADVQVKHATPLHETSLIDESLELVRRGLVDGALIFTGSMTGKPPRNSTLENIPKIKELLPRIPIFIGSGVDPENIQSILTLTRQKVDGFIIGSTFKENRDPNNPVNEALVINFLKKYHRAR